MMHLSISKPVLSAVVYDTELYSSPYLSANNSAMFALSLIQSILFVKIPFLPLMLETSFQKSACQSLLATIEALSRLVLRMAKWYLDLVFRRTLATVPVRGHWLSFNNQCQNNAVCLRSSKFKFQPGIAVSLRYPLALGIAQVPAIIHVPTRNSCFIAIPLSLRDCAGFRHHTCSNQE